MAIIAAAELIEKVKAVTRLDVTLVVNEPQRSLISRLPP
jgi:hypothetical protein